MVWARSFGVNCLNWLTPSCDVNGVTCPCCELSELVEQCHLASGRDGSDQNYYKRLPVTYPGVCSTVNANTICYRI
jgi:hypothetical protein